MDLVGEERISAPRQAVWDALNDIDTLKTAFPAAKIWNVCLKQKFEPR